MVVSNERNLLFTVFLAFTSLLVLTHSEAGTMFKGDTKNPPFSHCRMVEQLLLGLHLLDLLLLGHGDLLLAGAEHLPVDLSQVNVFPLDGLSHTISARHHLHWKAGGKTNLGESVPCETDFIAAMSRIKNTNGCETKSGAIESSELL